jgi:hypothetical protein
MKKYILFTLIIGLAFTACKNAYEKELGEVDSLLEIVNDSEQSLLTVDTSRVFSAKRQMEVDLAELHEVKDTLTKEEAFQLDKIFSSKKRIFRLTKNYSNFLEQINFSKTQLTNLKQDLENDFVSKDDFVIHIQNEKTYVLGLNKQINKAVNGLDVELEKLKLYRSEFEEIVEKRKHKATMIE